MFDDILTPLLLASKIGRVNGKTRFQKLVFLIQKEASARGINASSFVYELYHYGPFCSELTTTIEKLQADEMLEEEIEMTPSGYAKYVYSITNKGEKLLEDAKEKGLISSELEKVVADIAMRFGNKPLPEIVKEAYRRYLGENTYLY